MENKKVKTKKVNYNPAKDGSKKNLVLIGGFASAVIIIAALIFMTLSSLFSTETYYVLNQNVRANQQILPQMVTPIEAAEGTSPVHSLSMEEIQRGNIFSKYPLYAGDVVSRSNSGPLSDMTAGIPDDWVITSFTMNSTDAAGGILKKGDYADLIGVDAEEGTGAQYIFNNMMILEIKFLNEEYNGGLEGQTVVGETIHYTVGLPPEAAAYLHDALSKYPVVKLVKAPIEVNYQKRNLSKLKAPFKYGSEVGNIDVFEGTDPTFTEVERDEKGRPINKAAIDEKRQEVLDEVNKEVQNEQPTQTPDEEQTEVQNGVQNEEQTEQPVDNDQN